MILLDSPTLEVFIRLLGDRNTAVRKAVSKLSHDVLIAEHLIAD